MPQRKEPSSIGELYGKITITGRDFSEGESKLVKEKEHPFVQLCKSLYSLSPAMGKGGKFNEENKNAVEFLGWKLKDEEFIAANALVMYLSIFAALLLGIIFILTPLSEIIALIAPDDFTGFLIAFAPGLICAIIVILTFQSYPVSAARKEQTRALTYVPELMGYMVMSIKLVPNLEKAVEFAASHGRGKIADDFKELVWETQIGMYNSVAEALDALAYRWGKFSSEFKRALMRVRASVIENSEAKRYALLDQTMDEMLESIRNKMEQYARDLSQPSTILFYLGVLLPLLLIIILPVGSAFSGAPLANPIILFLIYNIGIPLVTIVFAKSLIDSRPPTYDPPIIPDSYPGLPKKWSAKIGGINIDVRAAAAIIIILGFGMTFLVSTQGLPPKFLYPALGYDEIRNLPEVRIDPDKSAEDALKQAGEPLNKFSTDPNNPGPVYRQYLRDWLRVNSDPETQEEVLQQVIVQVKADEKLFFAQTDNDITPSKLIFGILITFSIAAGIVLYYRNKYKRQAQIELQEMESEFKDSLYIIASRLGENKPIEDAMKHAQEFLPQYKISQKIFAKTLDNIKLFGMPLEAAVFDKNQGALANIPSNIIHTGMRMLVDSVQLGVNVAARTMISLSIQLQNSEKVNNTLKVLVSDITSTMKTMTVFIAPIVLGITTSLQRIVIVTIASIAGSGMAENISSGSSDMGGSFSGFQLSGFIDPKSIASIATPSEFIFIVALYVIELVVIMIYFTTKLEEDNDLLVKMNIARYLPIAIIVFVATMGLSNALLGVQIG